MNRILLIAGLCGLSWACTPDASDSGPDLDLDTDSDTSAPLVELEVCQGVGTMTLGHEGALTCATQTRTMDFDWFDVDVKAGDCVHIKADNGEGAADLVAFAAGSGGAGYGFAADNSQLDDELPCTSEPWSEWACPEASVVAQTDGVLQVLVGQWAGADEADTCTDGAAYTLWVAINGVDVDLSAGPTQQDTPLPTGE